MAIEKKYFEFLCSGVEQGQGPQGQSVNRRKPLTVEALLQFDAMSDASKDALLLLHEEGKKQARENRKAQLEQALAQVNEELK